MVETSPAYGSHYNLKENNVVESEASINLETYFSASNNLVHTMDDIIQNQPVSIKHITHKFDMNVNVDD